MDSGVSFGCGVVIEDFKLFVLLDQSIQPSKEFLDLVGEFKPCYLQISSKRPDYCSNSGDGSIAQKRLTFTGESELLSYLDARKCCLVHYGVDQVDKIFPCPSVRVLPSKSIDNFSRLDLRDRSNVLNRNQCLVIETESYRKFCDDSNENLISLEQGSTFPAIKKVAIQNFYPLCPNESIHFTIVTPSFNQGKYIRDTIDSVLGQNYQNFNYVVRDGGSTDETIDILKSYGGALQWVSEKDSGYAEAVNKGLLGADAHYGLWLPSDDLFFDEFSLRRLSIAIQKTNSDVIFGESFYFNDSGMMLSPYLTYDFDFEAFKNQCFICQPSTAFRMVKFEELKGLNSTLRSVGDYDLWIRLAQGGSSFSRLCAPVSRYRLQSNSITVSQRLLTFKEIFEIQLRHFNRVYPGWVIGALHGLFTKMTLKSGVKAEVISRTSPVRSILKMIKRSLMRQTAIRLLTESHFVQRILLRIILIKLDKK